MSLLPIGINNRIVQWRAKELQVDVFVHDASGLVNNLDAWDAYFYAKKYPIRSTADLDISIGYTSRLTNGFSFDLFPITLDISSGDYIYEIIIQGPEKEQISIVQDRFTILESLNLDYNDEIPIIISPSNYLFTVHDLIVNFNLTSMLSWEVISFPEWLSISSELGTGNYSGTITKDSSLENQSSGEIIFKNLYNNYGYFDASFFYSDLVLSKTSITFEPETPVTIDISTANINSWITSGIPNWLSYDISKGIGDSTITLEASIITEKPVSNITVDSSFSYQKSFDVSFYYPTTLTVDSSNPYTFSLEDNHHTFNVSTGEYNEWNLILPSWLSSDVSGMMGSGSFTLTVNDLTQSHPLSSITIESMYVSDVIVDASFNYDAAIWSLTGTYFQDGHGKEGYYFTSDTSLILYTNIPGLTAIESSVYVIGAGGGGGGGQYGYQSQGGGGGGGAVSITKIDISIGDSYNLIVGTGGLAENQNTPSAATNGGPSKFHSFVTVDGGGAGGGKFSNSYIGKKGGSGGGGAGYYDNTGNYSGTYGDASIRIGQSGNRGGAGASTATERYDEQHTHGGGGGGSKTFGSTDTYPLGVYGGAGEGLNARVRSSFSEYIGSGGPAGSHGVQFYGAVGRGGRSGYRFIPSISVPGTAAYAQDGEDGLISILWTKP